MGRNSSPDQEEREPSFLRFFFNSVNIVSTKGILQARNSSAQQKVQSRVWIELVCLSEDEHIIQTGSQAADHQGHTAKGTRGPIQACIRGRSGPPLKAQPALTCDQTTCFRQTKQSREMIHGQMSDLRAQSYGNV